MNKFFKAMFCVTFFSVATRALGFVLKIYLSRKLSSELLGSYQVAMSFFGVLMALVSSGIPVVLSRNVSYYHGQKNNRAIGSIVSSGLILTGIICTVVSGVVLFFPNLFSKIFTSNESAEMIKILLPALVFSSIYEVLRGALWGKQQFFVISFTEFLEQVTRIIIIILLFETTFLDMSLTNKTALSLSIACIVSSIVVTIIYFTKRGNLANPKFEFKNLIKTSTPITAVRTLSSAVSSIIAIIIPLRLMDFGYSKAEALSEFGIMMGMTFPLLMIPSTLNSSLAVTIIPSISEQSNDIDSGKLKNTTALKSKINFSLRTTVVFSTLLMPVFLALGIPICKFLFNNEKAGVYLSFACVCMLPMGLSQITSSILNAIGLEIKSLINYFVSAVFLILSITILPRFIGTYALIVGYLSMSVVASVMNIVMLKKRNLLDFKFLKVAETMLLISIISAVVGFIVHKILKNSLFISIAVGGAFTLACTLGLIFVFNVADLKFVIMKRKRKA